MSKLFERTILSFSLLLFLIPGLSGQTIPVGLGNYEDFLRRQQLEGNFDDQVSFNNRPLEIPDSMPANHHLSFTALEVDLLKTKVSVLSPQFHVEWNSHHPYYSNNGTMVPSKGFKSLTSFGIHVEAPFVSIQLRPEIYLSQNKAYEGFPDTLGTRAWGARYVLYNQADVPEQFGEGRIRDLLLGQSHALIYYKGIGLGFSTESLWWGPGKRNSLLMSNNARSFAHLTFRTQKPLRTPIGSFEWNVIAGRLEQSGFGPPERGDGRDLSRQVSKDSDWRYLSALTFSYHPKWIKGLSLGASRAVQQYQTLARDTKDYFPVAINLFRSNDPLERDEAFIDQLISTYVRWVWQDAGAEIYFEFGRNDAALNLRDLLLSPQHSRAYIFGFSKIFKLPKNALQLSYEHTQMHQATSYLLRTAGSWYMHSRIRQGYTHRGEVLGSAIGPGSNLDYFNVSYFTGIKRIGFTFERWTHDNDFHILAFEDIRDFRRYWIDYTLGLDFDWPYKNFMFTGDFRFSRSLNYQWEIHNSLSGSPYFVNGEDESNFFLSFKTIYLF